MTKGRLSLRNDDRSDMWVYKFIIAFGRQLGTMYRVACFDVPFKAEKIFEKRLDKLLAGFEIAVEE